MTMNFQSHFYCLVLALGLIHLASGEEQYQRISRDRHNEYRSRHHVGPLTLSEDLSKRAKQCAEFYALRRQMDGSCPYKNGAGENIWVEFGRYTTDEEAAKRSTEWWYSEEPKHDYNGDYQSDSAHFSQLVWKNSKEVGFGTGWFEQMIVGVALYNPAGNVKGQFQQNVIRP